MIKAFTSFRRNSLTKNLTFTKINHIFLKQGTFEKNKNYFKFVGLDKKLFQEEGIYTGCICFPIPIEFIQ